MKALFFLVAHAITGVLYAQSIEPLTVGDRLPDLLFPKVLQYKDPYFSTGEMEGMPLLLCSWNERCSVVRDFAVKLDSFQKAYSGKFQVLLVTATPNNEIQKALSYYDELQGSSLPIAVGDSNFRSYFPHKAAPLLVWVGKTGKIEALTAHTLFNQKNFLSFIKGEQLNLPLRKDEDDQPYRVLTSLMDQHYGGKAGSLMSYTYIGKRIPNVRSRVEFLGADALTQEMRFRLINLDLHRLYNYAYERFLDYHPALVSLKALPADLRDSSYCYEQIVKKISRKQAFEKMRKTLDEFFGVTSCIEKQKVKVLVLTILRKNGRFVSNPKSKPQSYVKDGDLVIRAIKPAALVLGWNRNGVLPYYVIDETGYDGRMDLRLPADLTATEALQQRLSSYDLSLMEAERVIEIIVLKKKE